MRGLQIITYIGLHLKFITPLILQLCKMKV